MKSSVYIIGFLSLCLMKYLDAVAPGPGPSGRTCPEFKTGNCSKGMPQETTYIAGYLTNHCIATMCDTSTDRGGWLLIQRRIYKDDWTEKTWDQFKMGFGTLCTDFWLGNEHIHRLTSTGIWELRIEMTNSGERYYAVYDNFKVLSEHFKYGLVLGVYSGNAGNEFSNHNYARFSTIDMDNDESRAHHCAQLFGSGWWFTDCFNDNLNGNFGATIWGRGVYWQALNTRFETQLNSTEMKIRLK